MHEILYRKEHLLFREAFKSFLSKEIIPFYDRWEKEGIIPKNAWKKMGMEGYLCPWLEKKYGGYACRTDNGESVKGHRISELRGFLEVDEGVSSVPRLPGWSLRGSVIPSALSQYVGTCGSPN
jgi:alkylation response protein AidB-like acyl-CoA dehydrogenase